MSPFSMCIRLHLSLNELQQPRKHDSPDIPPAFFRFFINRELICGFLPIYLSMSQLRGRELQKIGTAGLVLCLPPPRPYTGSLVHFPLSAYTGPPHTAYRSSPPPHPGFSAGTSRNRSYSALPTASCNNFRAGGLGHRFSPVRRSSH